MRASTSQAHMTVGADLEDTARDKIVVKADSLMSGKASPRQIVLFVRPTSAAG